MTGPTRFATSAVDGARKLAAMRATYPNAALAVHADDGCHTAVALIEFACSQDLWVVVDAIIQTDDLDHAAAEYVAARLR